MGLLGKLRSGLSSAAKHLKTKHFKMTAGELVEVWGKLGHPDDVYISFRDDGNRYEIRSVGWVNDHGRKLVEVWYLVEVDNDEEEVSNPDFVSERERLDPGKEVWIHMSEAKYEELVGKHGDFLGKFES
ncbi:hypothetical protein [Thermococcus sp.]|uniref:hypothetical protein n=1 Tax=Thermococcus sp. TaxID=35749 RepID=UPI00262B2728|nr:hypothetical protein [Thermococcus sp.]